MRGADLHHVGAVLGERAGAGRARQHARDVDHADAGKRAVAGRQRLGLALADPDDLHQRQAGDRDALRVARPLLVGAHHPARALVGDDRLFEIGGGPVQHGLGDGRAVLRHAQHLQRDRPMVGEIAMKVAPAPVPGRIEAHDAVARGRQRAVAELHVVAAAHRGTRMPQLDAHRLLRPAPHFPEMRRRQSRRRDRRRARLADMQRRAHHRIARAVECHLRGDIARPAGERQDRSQGIERLRHVYPTAAFINAIASGLSQSASPWRRPISRPCASIRIEVGSTEMSSACCAFLPLSK